MVETFLRRGKTILYGRQATILSAATVIMLMIAASRILGLARQRVLVHFFSTRELDSYFASFQLPDLIFEVIVLGAMSSAFIPTFAKSLAQKKDKEAWHLAGLILNVMLALFLIISALIFTFAYPLYDTVASGFTKEQVAQTVLFTRVLLLAQMFFAASYVFTAVLESNQRFLTPAVAPLFYNLGIILTTIFLAPSLGLLAPVVGAVIGSFLHLIIQLPLALHLGFRPILSLNLKNPALRKVGKLALPRIIELSAFQAKRLVDLFLASQVLGGLTFFKLADTVSVLPVSLFGLSIAKASLPQLSKQNSQDLEGFKTTFVASFRQILFFIIPASIFLAVLRVPIVRLAFGSPRFTWDDTLQTGYALSAFCVGIFAYSLSLLVSRAFYALHDTTTPVKVSFLAIAVNIILGLVFVLRLKLPIWSLALSYSLAGVLQFIVLFGFLVKKVGGFSQFDPGSAFAKVLASASLAGSLMFVLLRVLDRSAWDKKLSFLGELGLALPTTFERFVLDTRYTANLIVLTAVVGLIGLSVYLATTYFLGVREFQIFIKAIDRVPLFAPLKKIFPGPKTADPISPEPKE